MALLDALSRHSFHPLIGFASEEASQFVGFVRHLTNQELEDYRLEAQLHRKSLARSKSLMTWSIFELSALSERMLEKRKRNFELNGRKLVSFQGAELTNAIESPGGSNVFVLFWTETSNASVHAYELWSRTSSLWHEMMSRENVVLSQETVVLGEVACHIHTDVCKVNKREMNFIFIFI